MNLHEISLTDSVERDMNKCRIVNGVKPIWVLAHENNQKQKKVNAVTLAKPSDSKIHVMGVWG